jgi:outer membrane receptor protein involved in Fe transport
VAFNLNYRTKKLNFFTNYGIKYLENPSVGRKYQKLYQNDTTFIISQTSQVKQKGLTNNFRFGADYLLNSKNTLTAAFNYGINDFNNSITNTYHDFLYNTHNPIVSTIRTGDVEGTETNQEYSLTYKKTFEEKGRILTVDLRYQDEISREKSDFTDQFYDQQLVANGQPDLLQQSNNIQKLGQSIFQADYVHPLSKDHKFEAGIRNSIRSIDNDYMIEEWADYEWLRLGNLSNHFKYYENISAAYVQYGNKINKFSYLVGFRMEYSLIRTQLSENNESYTRDYFTPIPTLHLTYDLPQNHALQLSYSRRLRRPLFWDLNPFYSFSDSRNIFRGNPDLDPEFTHSVELGHIKNWNKGSFASAIYYRHTTETIERIRRTEEYERFVTQPQNLNTEDAFGLELTTNYSPFKWWRLNGNFNFYHAKIDGNNIEQDLESDTYSWFIKGSSKFIINKKTNIQARYYYRAPRQTPQGMILKLYTVDLAASRDIFNDKGALTLSIRDVFNSRKHRYIANGDNFFTRSSQNWTSRSITLSLNYRLNQK